MSMTKNHNVLWVKESFGNGMPSVLQGKYVYNSLFHGT